MLSVCANVSAQMVEAFGDDAADPVRLFERGQVRTRAASSKKRSRFTNRHSKCGLNFRKQSFNAATRSPRSDASRKQTAHFGAQSRKKNWSLPYPRSASSSCDKTVTKTLNSFSTRH